MKLTNKETGISFSLTSKEAANFFYLKNDKGEYINHFNEYVIQETCSEISTFKFFLGCLGLLALCYCSFYLFLQFNY